MTEFIELQQQHKKNITIIVLPKDHDQHRENSHEMNLAALVMINIAIFDDS